jgi:hypothetical protein
MKPDSIQDSTRYVVSDVQYGNIMPGKKAEMWRNIFLLPGARIKGGIWGNDLVIEGPDVEIEKSVYLRGSITIKEASGNKSPNNCIDLKSNVISPDSLLIQQNTKFRSRFHADLYLGQVNLSNAIVYGNVYASSAILKNTVVLGGVYCKKSLDLENVVLFTFKCRELKIGQNVSLLAPFGFAESKFELNHPVKAITFFNFSENDKNDHPSGIIYLDNDDVFQIKHDRLFNKKVADTDKTDDVYVLSIAERILNSSEIIQAFQKNRKFIEYISLGSHLSKADSNKYLSENREELEKFLFRLTDNKNKQPELTGARKIQEMIEKFKG